MSDKPIQVLVDGIAQPLATLKDLLTMLVEGGSIAPDGVYMTAYEEIATFCAIALANIERTGVEHVDPTAPAETTTWHYDPSKDQSRKG
jgi:hypothetical protein